MDVVGLVSDRTYDRTLVLLALLAPLVMFALSKWRSSLEIWYAPMDAANVDVFGSHFDAAVTQWLAHRSTDAGQLVVVTDDDCPCTVSTVGALKAAAAQSQRRDASVVVHEWDDPLLQRQPGWAPLVDTLPATPTLLVVDSGRLLYAGPVNAGSFCTTALAQVLGVTALENPGAGPLLNWVEKGCYCRLPQAPAA